MIKFYKEDFKYIKRSFISFTNESEYCYDFSVRGESANYLMNKYGLSYPIIEVHYFTSDNGATVTSRISTRNLSDVTDIEDDDLVELIPLLLEDVNMDLRNYEEYMCDDGYKKDSRWD